MHFRFAIPFPLKFAAAIAFLPALIPVAVVMAAVDGRRKRKAAASFHCLGCERLLGTRSVPLADADFRRRMKELRRAHPFAVFRIVRTCHAICPACGRRYTFRERERDFVLEAPWPSAAAHVAT
jgi:hypothetical protein